MNAYIIYRRNSHWNVPNTRVLLFSLRSQQTLKPLAREIRKGLTVDIPSRYYIYFWFINSALATGTGALIGLFFFQFFMAALLALGVNVGPWCYFVFPEIFFFLDQAIIWSFFLGKRRGEFEYTYHEKVATDARTNSKLHRLFKEAKEELRLGDPASMVSKFAEATRMFPESFVAHFRYAASCEILGKTDEAIAGYETAKALLVKPTAALDGYISAQIERVKTKGPSGTSASPGMQYVLY